VRYWIYLVWREASGAGNGRLLLDTIGRIKDPDEDSSLYLLMDRAYEDEETRWLGLYLVR
jgi:hypothetical protein